MRHIKFGEGDYDTTESLIRQLLSDAKPSVQLPPPVDADDTTPTDRNDSRDVLERRQGRELRRSRRLRRGSVQFQLPDNNFRQDSFALRGNWALDYQGATSQERTHGIALNYHAKDVYIVAGGEGTLTVSRNGKTSPVPISGPPTLHQIVDDPDVAQGQLEVAVPPGLQVFSFTYG